MTNRGSSSGLTGGVVRNSCVTTQSPTKWILRALGREAGHSLPYSSKIKIGGAILASTMRLHGVIFR
jgi:hypothetical protein